MYELIQLVSTKAAGKKVITFYQSHRSFRKLAVSHEGSTTRNHLIKTTRALWGTSRIYRHCAGNGNPALVVSTAPLANTWSS